MRNDTPELLLQNAADKIKELSIGKIFGIVVESFREEEQEYILSLHVISPKLKNYSYRLIELKCRNQVNPFPISAILFAYAPVNNQYASVNDYDSLSRNLDFLITHPLTKVILDHIDNMASLTETEKEEEFNLILNQINKERSVIVDNPSKPLMIKKIIVTSHFSSENNVWLNAVLNTSIKISCTGLIFGGTISNTFPLVAFVSPYHNRPVFDLNLIFPSNSDLLQFNQKLTNKLEYKFELDSSVSDVELSIVYEVNKYQANL